FTYNQARDSYVGEIKTLTFHRTNVQLRCVKKGGANEPDYRIVEETSTGAVEFGAAWKKTSKAGSEFLSVNLDDPALPKISAALTPEQNDPAPLFWPRPAKSKKEE